MPRSGRARRTSRAAALLLATVALLGAGCRYGYGFAGGGLPPNIRTAAVLPFDNRTPVAELQREVAEALRSGLERRLGLRSDAESRAHAVVRGSIVGYDADVPVAYSADPAAATSARRRLSLTIDVEIVDQQTSQVLFARQGVRAEGEYGEGGEAQGRRIAIERLVNDIIEGAQSQW